MGKGSRTRAAGMLFLLPFDLGAQIVLARRQRQTMDSPVVDPVQPPMRSTISPVAASTHRLTRTASHRDLSQHFHGGDTNDHAQVVSENGDDDDDDDIGGDWELPPGLVDVDESSDDGHHSLDSDDDEFLESSK
jgi:hypothetical protein